MTNKIAIIIAFKNFRDEEYFVPKGIFLKAGFDVVTISSEKGTAIGGSGGEAEVNETFEEFKVFKFDAVVLVGGSGAYKYIEDERLWKIIKQALEKDKIIGAICIAPAILARAGALKGRMATIWSSPMNKKTIEALREGGAIYRDRAVVRDSNIITANGSESAKEFAEAIVRVIQEKGLEE